MSEGKVEIMYFYSNIHENEKNLSEITRKLGRKLKDIDIRLVNVDEPDNEEITELYGVNMVPLLIFLTPKGQVAAKRFMPLSAESVVQEITDQINRGELPNPLVEEKRTKILDALKAVTKRNELTDLVVEQIESDLEEVSMDSEIHELVNSHISAINHAMNDLQELKRVLQKYSRKQDSFVV